MSDSFTPLAAVPSASQETTFTSIQFKGLPSTMAQPALTAAGPTRSKSEACSKPVVTLKRNGAIVSGIRIQCGCGQVVNLACVYEDVPIPNNKADFSQA
jgi:hypothetical protein